MNLPNTVTARTPPPELPHSLIAHSPAVSSKLFLPRRVAAQSLFLAVLVFAFQATGTIDVTPILGPAGDNNGHSFVQPGEFPVALDRDGNVFTVARFSSNAFRVSPNGSITQILDRSGDGMHAFVGGESITTDSAGNAY